MESKRFGKKTEKVQHTFQVTRAHQFTDGQVSFNLCIDGDVFMYGLRVYEGEKGPFISFPARKDPKDGKYWNHCMIKLDDEQTETIIRLVEERLA